jgi:hypothetical protein
MIKKEDIITWRKANQALLKEIGETDAEVTKHYINTKSVSDTDPDLLGLQLLEAELLRSGFAEPAPKSTGIWWTKYGDIEVRIFQDHNGNGKSITYTLVADGFARSSDNIEVASWVVKFDDVTHAASITKIHFSVASLVLPDSGSR